MVAWCRAVGEALNSQQLAAHDAVKHAHHQVLRAASFFPARQARTQSIRLARRRSSRTPLTRSLFPQIKLTAAPASGGNAESTSVQASTAAGGFGGALYALNYVALAGWLHTKDNTLWGWFAPYVDSQSRLERV